MRIFLLCSACVLLLSCQKNYEAPVPDYHNWEAFNSPNAQRLNRTTHQAFDGIYDLAGPTGDFGSQVVFKSNYAINNRDTVWHVSIFCGTDVSYFICEGRQVNGDILLNGYWRKMVNTETGIVRLTIKAAEGASILLSANPIVTPGSIRVKGVYGDDNQMPSDSISFTFKRKITASPAFHVLAHRGGGRTSDLLPDSENSIPMIKKTVEYGSTGVEIDVRLTKDDSLVLYHDANLNLRQTQKSGLIGPIENYTYAELSNFVRLIKGEKIPTLREALNTILYETSLTMVYLDTKFKGPMDQFQKVQQEFIAKAAAAGRNVEFLIGLPLQENFDEFIKLPNYTSVPSLCELTVDDVRKINAKVWAPRWTLGTQNDLVSQMHSEGRRVFVWTMDVPAYIDQFLDEGQLDGILTNYPSYVAYAHYIR